MEVLAPSSEAALSPLTHQVALGWPKMPKDPTSSCSSLAVESAELLDLW